MRQLINTAVVDYSINGKKLQSKACSLFRKNRRYSGMSSYCRLYKSFKYEAGTFTFPTRCFTDKDDVHIVLCQSFCGEDQEQEVTFAFDDETIKVLNKYGRPAKLKDLCPRFCYRGVYTSEADATIILKNTKC